MQTNQSDPERFIPISELCKKFDCVPRTFQTACERHGVSLLVLSPGKRGLMSADYALLLERARGKEVA